MNTNKFLWRFLKHLYYSPSNYSNSHSNLKIIYGPDYYDKIDLLLGRGWVEMGKDKSCSLSQETIKSLDALVAIWGVIPCTNAPLEVPIDVTGCVIVKEAKKEYPQDLYEAVKKQLASLQKVFIDSGNSMPDAALEINADLIIDMVLQHAEPELMKTLGETYHRLNLVLDHVTGGRMSKPNYTMEAMKALMDDHINEIVESEIDLMKTGNN